VLSSKTLSAASSAYVTVATSDRAGGVRNSSACDDAVESFISAVLGTTIDLATAGMVPGEGALRMGDASALGKFV
jgi:hypothetical protein